MIAIPAVDIRGGACVQLVGGSFADERVRIADAVGAARQWETLGFKWLHLVDLDAAVGSGDNAPTIDSILRESTGAVQVGGGVRSTERARQLLDAGAASVVVGTRAIEDPEWVAALATENPGRVIVAADVRERKLVTHGWARVQSRDILDLIADLARLPLGGLLVTAVHLEGQMRGTDLPLMEAVVGASGCPVIASGGVTTVLDLRALEQRGVAAAVIGMALYTGALDARAVAQEFKE